MITQDELVSDLNSLKLTVNHMGSNLNGYLRSQCQGHKVGFDL